MLTLALIGIFVSSVLSFIIGVESGIEIRRADSSVKSIFNKFTKG